MNVGQLNDTNTQVNKGFNIAGANGAADNVKLGETVTYDSTDGSIITTITDNNVDFALGSDLTVGGPGANGQPGKDGTIGVNGADGISGVVLNGKDGSIGLTGADGTNGTITVKDGTPGVDGKDGITRIVIDDTEVATLADGLKFAGNTGDTIAKKLNETLSIEGELADSATASGANLRVDSKDGKLNLVMARDLTELDSVTVGNSVLNTEGLTITGGPTFTSSQVDVAGNKITNVAAGTDDTDAVNVGQLNDTNTQVNKGFNIAGANGAADNVKLGETVTYDSTDGSIITTITDNNVDFALGSDLTVGGPGANGQPGKDGTIGVNGADGISGVVLNGKDGSIGLTGADGTNGTITVKDGTPGVDGKDGITRIVIDDTEVATLADGLKFAGNTGDTIAKKLNETLSIEGELADSATASGANLRVDSKDGKLNLVMARDLTELDSVTVGNSVLNTEGLTITGGPTFTTSKVDVAGNKITNVAAGTDDTDAVNVGQLNDTNTQVNKGFNIAGANGAADNVKLGETVTYDSTDGSIITTITDNNVDFALGSDLTVGGPGANGQPGKDGTIGVNGADGISGVVLNGKDGSIGLTGADGTNGTITVKDGTPGVDGKDGITRIVIDDTEVATLADGLKFAGNTGDTIAKKLNETLSIEGELADSATASGANLRVDSKDGKLNLVMARDLTELDSVTVGNSVLNTEGLTITGGPSITKTGIDVGNKVISNVAPGILGTDAVNVNQLNATNNSMNKGLNFAGDSGTTVNSKLGDTLNITGGVTDTTKLTGNNIGITANGNNGLTVKLAKDLTGLNSATFGDVKISQTGLDNGGNKIINVADGTIAPDSKDAVNGGQLNATAGSITNVIGGNATNVGGIVTTTDIGGTGKDTIDDAIKAVNTKAAQAKSTVTEGDNILVTKSTNADGSTDYKVATSKDLNVDSVTAGDNVLNGDGLTVGDTTVKNDGLTITGGDKGDVTLGNAGLNNGGNVITGVGAGKNDTDAVNVGQLNNVVAGANKGFNVTAQGGNSSNVANGGTVDFNNTDGNIKVTKPANDNEVIFNLNKDIDLGNDGSVTTGNTVVNNDGVTIKDGPSITATGINAGGKVVTGVADGVIADGSTDAINGGQLNNFGNVINNSINELGYKIGEVEDDANAGISAAMAMSSIPQSFLPGRSLIGGGIATYNGESAVAVGLSRVSDNGRWVMKLNGTADTQGNAGAAIGAGFHF